MAFLRAEGLSLLIFFCVECFDKLFQCCLEIFDCNLFCVINLTRKSFGETENSFYYINDWLDHSSVGKSFWGTSDSLVFYEYSDE